MPRIGSSSSSPHIDASEAEAYDLPTDAEIDAELSRLEGNGPISANAGADTDIEAQTPFLATSGPGNSSNIMATASQYRLQRGERLRGVANRIIFSRYYVLFYGVMMVLSLATVVLSLMARGECCFLRHPAARPASFRAQTAAEMARCTEMYAAGKQWATVRLCQAHLTFVRTCAEQAAPW